MGVIKDGTISGNLPSTKLFAVHYPAYPSSIQRAVETLGGLQGIQKARSSETNKLELHFRPEDPYSHPAFGELFPSKSFLLKISRKEEGKCENANDTSEKSQCSSSNIHQDQESSCPESIETLPSSQPVNELNADSANIEVQIPNEIQENLFADITAEVSEAYEFNGMADYQHVLAVHADVARRKKRNWADVEPKFDKQGLMDVDQEDLMILVPPLFSPKDIPERVALKPLVDVSLKKKQEGLVQNHWEMDIEPCLAIDFNIKEVPKKVSWENHIPKGSVQWGLQVAICNLFDERPIWKKDSFVEQLVDKGLIIGDYMLRRLLFRAAYYFSNGPFLKFWIRKGYDPRKDPESRIYQRTDFRVPPSLRSYCDANVGLKQKWKDICSFRVFPYKCQTSFQLVELVDDYIQEEIRKASNQPICSLATGWFSSHMLHTLRLRVHVRFLEICPLDGGKPFLKSASDRFEKAKKMQFLVKDQKLDNAQEEIEKGSDLVDNEDDEDDEDEIEDDNAEEGFDAYDGLDLTGEEGHVSVQTGLLPDNISKNYLQELFGSFPFSEAGGDFQLPDAANSDEEYQIYEQDSDGNYSGDDY